MPRRQNIDREIEGLVARMTNRAEKGRRAGTRRLDKGTEVIQDLAKMYAPVDKMNLEDAIKVRKDTKAFTRTAYEVYVDETMMVPDRPNKTIGDYALMMHESIYELGEKSADKDASVGGNGRGYLWGGKVGPQFLTRALDKYGPKIERDVKDAIKRGLK